MDKVAIERETLERAATALTDERPPTQLLTALRAALAAQPADCGNTPYDEGPFTLAQPAEPVAEVHAAHLRSSDENGGHWCREVLLYSGNSPHDWLNGKNTRVKLYAAASPAPAAVPLNFDVEACIRAGWKRHKYAQGTGPCVAFYRGAKWLAEIAAAAAAAGDKP